MGAEILRLNEIGRGDVSIAGGKGANLGELIEAGFPVPPGFVVSAQVCEAFFNAIQLEKEYGLLNDATPDNLAQRCRTVQRIIEEADFPTGLSDMILSAHEELAKNRDNEIVYAVRSSATAEDLGNASFAGQHATYYYVERDRLLKMTKSCWASLWSPEAVSYRTTQGIDHASVFMAVVVQEMILSEISGVTFTANPVTGSRDEVVTESSWGMGAAIVDGRVTPDHYVIEREGLKLREKRIAEKRFMVPPRLDKGRGTRLNEVPHDMRHRETLSSDTARMVAEWSIKAEEHFGSPQDVEWAITDGEFFMLQSRPITVMGREEIGQDVEGQYVVFKSLLENFTDPLTTLTGDIMRLLFPAPLVRLIRGWCYISLKHVRAILPFKVSDNDFVKLLYNLGSEPPSMKLSLFKLPIFLIMMFLSYLTVGVLFARTRRMSDDFMDDFRNLAEKVDKDNSAGPFAALKRLLTWSKFLGPIGHQVLLANVSSLRYFFGMNILQTLLRRWIPDIKEDAESLLCSGAEGVLSAEMGRGIWALAKEAKRSKSVCALLEKHKSENVLAKLRTEPEAQAFLVQLDRFLSMNGHRAMKELELQSVRWEENPAPVLGMVRNYLLVETDPEEHERKMNRTRNELEKEVSQKLQAYPLERAFGLRFRLIRYIANRAKFFSGMRENSRFYHIMGFYVVRKKILRVEADFMDLGKLKCKGDIFFLHLHEINRMQTGELDWQDVEDRIRERRMEHVRLSKMVPPKTLGIKTAEEPGQEGPATESSDVLLGHSASPGSYEGKAHVILDPSIDIELKPGEILIAPYTDPAWTPLFLTAGAAVIEIGSYLSHAGTVAREFGMPCVVDLKDCTKLIHTGVRVQVDGDRGVVRLLSNNEEERS